MNLNKPTKEDIKNLTITRNTLGDIISESINPFFNRNLEEIRNRLTEIILIHNQSR